MPYFLLIPLWFLSIVAIGPLFFVRKARRFSVRWMLGSTLALWPSWIFMFLFYSRPHLGSINWLWVYIKIMIPVLMIAGAWFGVRLADRCARKYGWPD